MGSQEVHMFTVCVFTFATLFTNKYASMECRENVTQSAVDRAKAECDLISKDPFMTCEMTRMADDKYVVYIRKLDGV